MNDPYTQPTTEDQMNESRREENIYNPKRPISIAIVVVACVGILSALYDYLGSASLGASYAVLSCAINVFFSWYVVLAIHKMANGQGANGTIRKLGAWGFVWRFYITLVVGSIPTLLIMMPFYPNYAVTPSITTSLISTVLLCISATCVIWALFSNNRRQQLHWLSRLLSRV